MKGGREESEDTTGQVGAMEMHACSCESQHWALGHLQTLTGLSPVSGMWPWAQVCTLAMHKEQRYQKHTEYTEYLIVGVFLLRKPSLVQTNLKGRSHHYTNNMPRGMFLSG